MSRSSTPIWLFCGVLGSAVGLFSVASAEESSSRLPMLTPDREPIDLLRRRPPDVDELLEQRERQREEQRAERRVRQQREEDDAERAEAPEWVPDEEMREALETPPASAMIEVERVWVEETAQGAGMARVEIRLHNEDEHAHELARVFSDVAAEASVRATVSRSGVEQTRALTRVHLPPGETIDLRPGGPQLVLIDLQRPLTRGEAVRLVLQFNDRSYKTVEAPVRHAPWREG